MIDFPAAAQAMLRSACDRVFRRVASVARPWDRTGMDELTRQTAPGPADLEALQVKLKALLPPLYQGRLDQVPTTSMGSATLAYGPDGKVAWDKIWTSFCHLALAGGPPHRGTLLEPVRANDAAAAPEGCQATLAELKRAIG